MAASKAPPASGPVKPPPASGPVKPPPGPVKPPPGPVKPPLGPASLKPLGPNAAKPTAKSLVKPMGAVAYPNEPDPLIPLIDEENNRFVIQLFDGDCEVIYEIDDLTKTITFHAISIPETAQGQGIGKKLAHFAFDYAIENELDVVIKSSFLADYYMKQRNCRKYAAKYTKLRVTGRYPQETIDQNY